MNKTLWGKQILTESLRTLVKNRNIHCTFFEPSRANDCCTTSSRRHCWWRCWRINVWFSFVWRWRYQTDARRWGRDQRSLLQRSISVLKRFSYSSKVWRSSYSFLVYYSFINFQSIEGRWTLLESSWRGRFRTLWSEGSRQYRSTNEIRCHWVHIESNTFQIHWLVGTTDFGGYVVKLDPSIGIFLSQCIAYLVPHRHYHPNRS